MKKCRKANRKKIALAMHALFHNVSALINIPKRILTIILIEVL